MQVKNIGTEKAWQKIKHYCAYQERSHAETRDKLYGFGLYKQEVETLLCQLIEENYLNEERFAVAFAGGKFRMNHWGRIKIKYELQQKRVSTYCIKMALSQIDEADYEQCLHKLARTKWASFKSEASAIEKRSKLQGYLLQKGFESQLVSAIAQALSKEDLAGL